jgi:hypothetical protein
VHVVAQDLLQRGVQQMRGAVGPLHRPMALVVHGGGDDVPYLQAAEDQHAGVHEFAALVLLHVRHVEAAVLAVEDAVVGHLAAHLGIQRGAVQHHGGLGAGDDLVLQLAIHHDGQHLALGAAGVVAGKLRRRASREPNSMPAQPGRPGPLRAFRARTRCSSIRESKPLRSTLMPSSAAISAVRSMGKP